MKRCPKCGQTFTDDNLNYCLSDGTPLSDENSAPTVVIPKTEQSRKGSSVLLMAAIALFALLIGGILGGLFFYNYNHDAVNVRVDRKGTSPLPTSPAKPQPSPTSPANPAVAGTSPATPETEPSPGSGETDEVVPIAWDTTASGFKGESGKTYRFECPKGGSEHAVYGSDVYADYSSICSAAVHAGLIKLADGGVITLEYRPGRTIYGSTERNGIKSNPTSEGSRSFVVR
jgi:LCCL domain